MKTFFLYNKNNPESEKIAQMAKILFEKSGVFAIESADEKADLTETRFLLFVIDSPDDFTNAALTEKWRFFQNELRWKRKTEGDIIMIINPSLSLSRLPFALRDCSYLLYGETEKLPALIKSLNGDKKDLSAAKTAGTSFEINRPESIKQPEQINSLKFSDEPKKEPKRVDKGCKEDHLYVKSNKPLKNAADAEQKIEQKKAPKIESANQYESSFDDKSSTKAVPEKTDIPDPVRVRRVIEDEKDSGKDDLFVSIENENAYEETGIEDDSMRFDWKSVNTKEAPDNSPFTYEDEIKETDAFLEELKKKAESVKKKAPSFILFFFFLLIFIIIMSSIT